MNLEHEAVPCDEIKSRLHTLLLGLWIEALNCCNFLQELQNRHVMNIVDALSSENDAFRLTTVVVSKRTVLNGTNS